MSSDSFDLTRMREMMFGGQEEEPAVSRASDVTAELLRDALAAYDREHSFLRGDLIQQKSGLRKYSAPDPVIFVRYLAPPEQAAVENYEGESGKNDGEVSDCVIGTCFSDGALALTTACSARFEPWVPIDMKSSD